MSLSASVNKHEWLEFSDIFKTERLPETLGGELLALVDDDLALAKVIYGILGASCLDWLKNHKCKFLEHKSPLQCIQQNRFDLLYPYLMAATATDGERGELKANLLKLLNNKHINTPRQIAAILGDQHMPTRRRVLIAQIMEDIAKESDIKFH